MTVTFRGWDEAIKAMAKVPEEVAARIKRDGMVRACSVVVTRAKELCPSPGYPGDDPEAKALRDTLGFRVVGYDESGTVVGIVGSVRPGGAHGHLVHGGVKPHTIRVNTTRSLVEASVYFGRDVLHPGQAAQPYIENAGKDTAGAQEKAIVDSIVSAVNEVVMAQGG